MIKRRGFDSKYINVPANNINSRRIIYTGRADIEQRNVVNTDFNS
jgi:hypothetical protein